MSGLSGATLVGPPTLPVERWDDQHIRWAIEWRDVGLFIRAWREAHWPLRISQERTARWLRTSQPRLSLLETGQASETNVLVLEEWFQILKVPDEYWWFRHFQ